MINSKKDEEEEKKGVEEKLEEFKRREKSI